MGELKGSASEEDSSNEEAMVWFIAMKETR